MRDAGKDQLLNVGQYGREGLAFYRGIGRQRSPNLSGFSPRKDGERLDARLVVGDPVHDSVPVATEFVGRHVKRLLSWHWFSESAI